MNTIHTNLHTLLQSASPYFADDRLEYFDRSKLHGVPYTSIPAALGSVDLSKVKGTDPSNYCNSTWMELLPTNPDDFMHLDYWERFKHQGKMKRGWSCIQSMRDNPAYYISVSEKDNWSFCKVGDHYYISQGNHRTVMARFLLSLNGLPEIVRGVSVTEYHVPRMASKSQLRRSIWKTLKECARSLRGL